MEEISNPYIAGAPVTEKRMFFGREDVFSWIERSLSGHILVVHGQRRVGKTSVLKQLSNHLPDRYIPILFDLQGRTNTTLDRFMWWLASGIVRVLKQERDITIAPPDRDLFARDPDYFENRFLPDLRPQLGEDKVLLLTFDEFDNLEEGEVKTTLARPLIDQLRRLMEQSNLNFIFSIGSSGRKLENMQATYTEFFKAALYKKISFLTKDDGQRLITLPVQGIIEYENDAVQQIYEIVSGHPYFTQLMCHELFSQCQKTGQRTISRVDVDAILDDVVERGTVNLKFVWDEAIDLEKWALSGLAHLEGKRNNRALADFLKHQRAHFNQQELDSALLHLREKDVLTEDNRFVNQLLQIWMKKNRPIEQAREELTEVNPIANRFIGIGIEYKNSGMYDKAIVNFKEALQVDSGNLQAQVSLALVYLDQKNVEKAIVEFEKALLIDDEDIATRTGLCDAYLAQGDQARAMARPREADAIKAYQKILAINGEHNEARQRMAEINRQRAEKALVDGRDEEALSAFTEALKYTPDDPSLIERVERVRAEKKAKVLAAQIARSEKEVTARNWEKAIAALNEALETSPKDESILKKIELIKERQQNERLDAVLAKVDQAEKAGRWDTAIAALNEYLNLKPDDTLIQKRLSDLVEAKHTAWLNAIITRADQAVAYQGWDEAFAALNEVLALESDNLEIQKKLAAVREERRIAELNALLKRVEAAVQAGRWDDAINDLNNGVASEPENETLQAKLTEVRKEKREARLKAAMRLVDSATQAGNWDAAIEMLNEMLAVEPENAEFKQKLTEVREALQGTKKSAPPNTRFIFFSTAIIFTLIIVAAGIALVGWLTSRSGAAGAISTSTPSFTLTPPAAQTLSATNTPIATITPTATAMPKLDIGSTRTGSDGMTLLYVPAGEFTMGSDTGHTDERPVHTVYLDAFWIDQTEVTNDMYKLCVQSGKCAKPSNTDYYGFTDYPVVYVNWNDAAAYCSWAGRRLPTEAEWEKAARGTDGRTYPWGNEAPNDNLLNYNRPTLGGTAKVGSYPNGASPYGAYDMAGNVYEWVNDWYGKTYYQNSPPSNPLGPDSSEYRVLRSGAWNDVTARVTYRNWNVPANEYYNSVGFRCASSPNTPDTTNTTVTTVTPATSKLDIGSTMTGSDGITLLYVPAGEFTMGSDSGHANERPVHTVYLDAFWIDQTEVTNDMYKLCVQSGKCAKPSSLDYYSFTNYPVVNVNWNDAAAYCSWAGRRLPTEAEWEKAARGTDGRTYPWGNEAPNKNLLNYNQSTRHYRAKVGGSYPDGVSPYGAYDMAGNVWEWVNDWYSETYYQSSLPSNPTGPDSGENRVIRGGAWTDNASSVRSAYRLSSIPTDSGEVYSFRCASSP